jgi:hypothetical protein
MFDEFLIELAEPAVKGFFRRARTSEMRRWKLAAWAWICVSIASFLAISQLEHPVGVGLAFAGGMFGAVASFVASASASVVYRRWLESQSPPKT